MKTIHPSFMNNPIATYRIQFNKDFTFKDFEKQLPYFQKLGIGTVYASPVMAATPGSTHGYDGVNPDIINPEIGTEEQLRTLSAALQTNRISWLQDIVPNHMAFHSENTWLMDVLEKGPQSEYAAFFDIGGNSKLFQGKLMVPFLGAELSEVIAAGQLKLQYIHDRLQLVYQGSEYPVNIRSYMRVLGSETENVPEAVQSLVSQLAEIHEAEVAMIFSLRWNEFLMQFASLMKNEAVSKWVDAVIEQINGDENALDNLAHEQEYQLCFWQKTDAQINFRRFFTVNGLICLNMQRDDVFDRYHQFTKKLLEEGIFQGLRIDHIDGLYDPDTYLAKLRELAGPDAYIVVEKILEQHEDMPANWPIEGTSGYEFLADVNNLFTNPLAEQAFSEYYDELVGKEKAANDLPVRDSPVRDSQVRGQLLSKKALILEEHMGGELDNLYRLFTDLHLVDDATLEAVGKDNLKTAIGEFLIHCPVYRYYGNAFPLSETESTAVKAVFDDVRAHHPDLENAVAILESAILETTEEADEIHDAHALEFYQRLMQFTGPLMAKGGEDTLMYTNNRFVGHNDVGDFPDRFGMKAKDFHQRMRKRQEHWPLSLNTTSTHDTKRGEDVRARLNVLTELSEGWIAKVKEWQELNKNLKSEAGPTPNDEYLIYQTLTGAYPMPGEDDDDFEERLKEYLQKALREAKTETTWAAPNESYEKDVKDFAAKLLSPSNAFFQNFQDYLSSISDFGIINSLSQVLLKFTCPGVPDVYQGTELWDLSLVDPDNRRAFDYAKREKWLKGFEDYDADRLLEKLWETRNSGQIKLWLTSALYHLRKSEPDLFAEGSYIPLKTRGVYKDHILAFARKYKRDFVVVAIPLHTAMLSEAQGKSFFELDWKDTTIVLPDNLNPEWADALTDLETNYEGKLVPSEIFKKLPLAVLKGSKPENERKAGVLLHLTSLAAPFGIGDMGPEAFAFADFLASSGQRIWQLLPLNPVEAAQSNSPYSALSSRAGNPLFISPEILMEEGLLDAEKVNASALPNTDQVDYDGAADLKRNLLKEAFAKFQEMSDAEEKMLYDAFQEQNAGWLEDFAVYMLLKQKHEGQPWYEWPEKFRKRDEAALTELKNTEPEKLELIRWKQYVFDKQWKALKAYCNNKNISLLGDIPFYVSYDSADVWAHPEFFRVDEEGKITGIAGVPPDAFSDDGQLWGMPVFEWEALKKDNYQWWMDRLAKNIELFDVVRLDHFRAFADYWEVPGGEKTAVKGEWKLGPGEAFFQKAKAALGGLPFIAEDLGEMTPDVYKLRDQFALPGMKVLQFAFDENMPQSEHIAHNFSNNFYAYTGTHDNNTTRGWFQQSDDAAMVTRISKYTGVVVDEENVAGMLARLTFGSVAKAAILPMQDVLNLDESAIMNRPGSSENNWGWRLKPGQITPEASQFLLELTTLFHRS